MAEKNMEFENREVVEVETAEVAKPAKKSLKQKLKKPAIIAGSIIAAMALYSHGKKCGENAAKARQYDELEDDEEVDEECEPDEDEEED